jgi:hypothetical protein
MLAVSEQELVTTDSELLQTVESTFQGIFSVNTEVQNNTAEREEVLSHIPSSVTPTENEVMCAVPDTDEITDVVFNLKKEKAPALDGITAEMLQTCWEL